MDEGQEALQWGARTAVRQCLGVTAADRVLVITDVETAAIGKALRDAATELGAPARLMELETFGTRPFRVVPPALAEAVRVGAPTVSFFAAQGQEGEISFRIALGRLLRDELGVRHGHMIGISEQLMRTGMHVDYALVAARTMQVYERVRRCRQIRVTNPDGTDLIAAFDPDHISWVPWTGLYHQQRDWGNLPEGETFTSPLTMSGVLTARILGDHFGKRYGVLDSPVRFELADSLVRRIDHPNQRLATDLWAYLKGAENGDRVGEFAIGTNEYLPGVVGNLLQDEKLPGLHVAFGDPYGHFTGANWSSTVHVDVIPLATDIWVDGALIMAAGRFLPDERLSAGSM